MDLAEKIKHLREVEGELRGYNRPMTQTEVVKTMEKELGESISQAYLSQLESAKRLHLTAKSRDLLARFFKVHPGYLVSDPPNFSTDLLTTSMMESDADRLTNWLRATEAEWNTEPELQELLQALANSQQPRRYIEIFRKLTHLSLEELEAIVDAVMAHEETTNRG
ncbi:MAG: helix-turn-helix transcriptional regulator [Ktedonobacteraceae bacterium]|nr:helix-turn-helix transcriptional regulator [Ktedonobacteraceae bacterium]